ncbi:MAG: formate dehydrogenase major subunit [Chloroflexota bacterium]|jgi:formate dehydrogenase major subunit|nr:formate dehydrogenase major subunit [Chloroflexota bacterium]
MDLANADCVLVMGSNMAENHPVGFRFVMEAREKGAEVIHVDPRFTRTSAAATRYVPMRSGSDIVFLGALVNHVLTNEADFRPYVVHYTNATAILPEEYVDAEDGGGLFSGLVRPDQGSGDGGEAPSGVSTTAMAHEGAGTHAHGHGQVHYDPREGHWGYGQADPAGPAFSIDTDPTLQHQRCVYQVLKRHFARYTPEMVERVCGTPRVDFEAVADAMVRNSGPERTTVVCYAVGWTQQSVGPQIIRTAGILQLLLGNIGRPGGGILALRGHASIQGSTDIPTLYDLLPGYIPQPLAGEEHKDLAAFLKAGTLPRGLWSSFPAYFISLLKAWYGPAATAENDFAYEHLPKRTGDHSQQATFATMLEDRVKGYLVLGQNPAAGNTNARLVRGALEHLDWMVVRDLFETETASFWYRSPGVDPLRVKTEVILMPAAASAEKDGTFTNTQRLLQYHDKAVDPPGDARSETWFMYHLGVRLKELYHGSSLPRDRPILDLTWDYAPNPEKNARFRLKDEPDVERIIAEINGYRLDPESGRRRQLQDFTECRDDGSTACGAWIYSGVMPDEGVNNARRRKGRPPTFPEWGFAWPKNIRMLYNRASADPSGKPWSERKRYVWWDEAAGSWTGLDTPDFPVKTRPDHVPAATAAGLDGIAGDSPFQAKPDGKGWLFAPSGMADGPLPTFYEPTETSERNAVYAQQDNPMVKRFDDLDGNRKAQPADPAYPYVLTTFRVTEHHVSGQMSRWSGWLSELQPELYLEISPELAHELGIEHRGWVTVETPRARVEARAMVTARIRPFEVAGRTLHQVAIPFHFGYAGRVTGDIANDLLALTEEPNVAINETKALVCNVRPGRRPR